MQQEALLIGYVVLAIITLGAFVGVVWKFTQPITELRVVIQKLNDNIDTLKSDNTSHGKRLDKHDEQIGELDNKVVQLQTRVNMYHKGQ